MSDAILKRLQQGLQLQRAGRLGEAETCYRAVLAVVPSDARALNLLGALCVNSRRPDQAVTLIGEALRQRPNDPQAHGNLGLAFKDLGRFEEAARHFRESLRLSPGDPVMLGNLGNVLRELGQQDDAIKCYELALQFNPGHAEGWCNLAAVGCDIGRYERALVAADRALALKPRFAEAWAVRGDIHRKLSRLDEAAHDYRNAIELNPGLHEAMVNLADTERSLGHARESESILGTVLAADPGNALAWHSMGVLKEQLGDREAAAEALCRAIELGPEIAVSHYQLAQLRGRRTSDAELRLRSELYMRPDLTAEQRVYLGFALGLAHEQRSDHEQAFRHWAAANRVRAETHPYDHEKSRDFVERIIASFEASPPANAAPPDAGPRPVFVLGMPRSGTSLTEQILASHPLVVGAGELPYMEATTRQSEDLTGVAFPESCLRLTDEQCAILGHNYMSRHASMPSSTRYVVDKTPMNFQYIGLISRILPHARIIHCRRDPVDVCLSIFQRPFEASHRYSHDLESLGTYYQLYARLMAFWRSQRPLAMLEVTYEDTVADVAAQSRRMLDFLDLPFDEAVLAFHSTRRLVRTPSAMQVRQPIYSDSVNAWKRYEKHLGPLLDALHGLRSSGDGET
jgi:tetratricopeptide (TPR) repeat protein